MDTADLLEAAIGYTPPLLSSSSQVVPLPLSSSSSDALPSSSVVTFNMADHDPPTEDEQPKKEEGAARKKVVTFNITDHDPPSEDEQPKNEEGAAHKKGSSQSHDFLGTMQGKDRRRTRRRRTGQSSFTNSTLSTDVT